MMDSTVGSSRPVSQIGPAGIPIDASIARTPRKHVPNPSVPSWMSATYANMLARRRANPLAFRPDKEYFWRLQGSVILAALPQTFLVALWSAAVVGFFVYFDYRGIDSVLVPILSPVIGLLLVFRTNSAYDRYWEGRRLWGQLTSTVLSYARLIWIHCPERDEADKLEKVTALKLLIAFPYAVKHHLRNEHGLNWVDIQNVVPQVFELQYDTKLEHLHESYLRRRKHPDQATPESPKGPNTGSLKSSKMEFNPVFDNDYDVEHTHEFLCGCVRVPNLINELLTAFVRSKRAKDQIHFMMGSNMYGLSNQLQEMVSSLERILSTPLPLAYSLHLKHAMMLYLFSLPFQVLNSLKWWTIPAVAVVAFTMIGLERIGREIENRNFWNDLPQSRYCEAIRDEIQYIISRSAPDPDVWPSDLDEFSPNNPSNNRNGGTMRRKPQKENPEEALARTRTVTSARKAARSGGRADELGMRTTSQGGYAAPFSAMDIGGPPRMGPSASAPGYVQQQYQQPPQTLQLQMMGGRKEGDGGV
ncbi:Bestrophin, RFP-TM, chloride channel-domain-containing protein [Cladochytrium replicatum]|nr:Bestrophin, RFP-TM, chloride channel-domain-containing protein [Cladochytrium replicatum]